MKRTLFAIVMCLWAASALAQENAAGKETAAAADQPAKGTTEAAPAATTAKAKEGPDFKMPPGFYEKKVGKHMLYCKKDAPMGTRIRSERCMNDGQMREYLLALEAQKAEMDRIRATCATASVCAPP
jgi:hypothetical protein